jgi:hypothetical protein
MLEDSHLIVCRSCEGINPMRRTMHYQKHYSSTTTEHTYLHAVLSTSACTLTRRTDADRVYARQQSVTP